MVKSNANVYINQNASTVDCSLVNADAQLSLINIPQGFVCVYIWVNIQLITMCPYSYHHNGFMATPALGTQDVRFGLTYTLIILQDILSRRCFSLNKTLNSNSISILIVVAHCQNRKAVIFMSSCALKVSVFFRALHQTNHALLITMVN